MVPMHDELAIGTLQEIVDQWGANDFHRFCDWLAASLKDLFEQLQSGSA